MVTLKAKLERTKAERVIFKAQLESGSSTSVQNQLSLIRDDIDGLKFNLVLKLNVVDSSSFNMNYYVNQRHKEEMAVVNARVDALELEVRNNHFFCTQNFGMLR